MQAVVGGNSAPRINQVVAPRGDLPGLYQEVIGQNPLLIRIERECKSAGWTDEEIRTVQLLAACRSNHSLSQRLSELELSLAARKLS